SRRRHTISKRDWSSDVCSSDLGGSNTWEIIKNMLIKDCIHYSVLFQSAFSLYSTSLLTTLLYTEKKDLIKRQVSWQIFLSSQSLRYLFSICSYYCMLSYVFHSL